MKRKLLVFCLTFLFILPCVIILNGCGTKPYNVKLSKDINENCFEMKVTDDFSLYDYSESNYYIKSDYGITLESDGDNEICFNSSSIVGKIAFGNKYYSTTIGLDKYAHDIGCIEKLELKNPEDFTLKERVDDELRDINCKLYIVNEKTNPNGNWDYYDIFILGKTDTYFVNFKFLTSIENKNLKNWTKKCKTIANTIILNPQNDLSFDQSVTGEITEDIKSSGEYLKGLGMVLHLPNDYEITTNEVAWLNYLGTKYNLTERWSSGIRFSYLGAFMGVHYANLHGVENLVSCANGDVLGYYLKGKRKDFEQGTYLYYYIYFFDETDNLMEYTMTVSIDCSEELENLGFKNYFETQLIEWLYNMEFVQQ